VEFAGDSPWKARAYRQVAAQLRAGRLDPLRPDTYDRVPGVGPKIRAKLLALARGEGLARLERLRAEQPPELPALLALPGIGPRTARRLWEEAGIGRVEELAAALAAGRPLPGVSSRQEADLRRALAARREGIPLPSLLDFTRELEAHLRGLTPAGALRRLDPLIPDPLWLAPDDEPNRRALAGLLPATLPDGFVVPAGSVRLVPAAAFGPALAWATGPEAFSAELVAALAERGWRLAPDGLYDTDGRLVPVPSEEELFARAGLPPVPPHLRGLPAAAREDVLTAVKGDLHAHSDWSDGEDPIAEMVRAALSRGYTMLAITDHSHGLKVANGLSPERLQAQRREIEAIRRTLPEGFQLLHGCEVDIRPDGTLDLPDDVLAELDLVIASIHGDFQQPVEAMTARLLKALAHPAVTILGHPGARKLGRRPMVAADWDRVFAAASHHGVALEMSASPRRLDLDARLLKDHPLKDRLRIAVDTDAHSRAELEHMPLGIAQVAKAGIRPAAVLNTWPAERVRTARGAPTRT
jgi:DNA polymerase (family 10)